MEIQLTETHLQSGSRRQNITFSAGRRGSDRRCKEAPTACSHLKPGLRAVTAEHMSTQTVGIRFMSDTVSSGEAPILVFIVLV